MYVCSCLFVCMVAFVCVCSCLFVLTFVCLYLFMFVYLFLFVCLRVESTIQYMTFEKYERCPRSTTRYQKQNTISIQQVEQCDTHPHCTIA